MSSTFRTRSLPASPASSSPPCRRRKLHVRPVAPRPTLPLTISIYALMQWSGRHGKSRKRSMCCYRLCVDGSGTDPDGDSRKGVDFAQRALEVAGDDPEVIVNAALALSYFGADINAMIALVDRALALNPNFARGWHVGGILGLFAGQPDLSIEHAETALRLSPRARVGTSLSLIGQAHFLAQRFDEAVPKLLLAIQEDPSFPAPYRY